MKLSGDPTVADLCCVCEEYPVTQVRNQGRWPSVTCCAECANMLNVCGSVEAAREKYRRKHAADFAIKKFIYGKEK